jgi:hypothetical protein
MEERTQQQIDQEYTALCIEYGNLSNLIRLHEERIKHIHQFDFPRLEKESKALSERKQNETVSG